MKIIEKLCFKIVTQLQLSSILDSLNPKNNYHNCKSKYCLCKPLLNTAKNVCIDVSIIPVKYIKFWC